MGQARGDKIEKRVHGRLGLSVSTGSHCIAVLLHSSYKAVFDFSTFFNITLFVFFKYLSSFVMVTIVPARPFVVSIYISNNKQREI